MSSPTKRRDMDVMKLMMSSHEVQTGPGGSLAEFYVKFNGPSGEGVQPRQLLVLALVMRRRLIQDAHFLEIICFLLDTLLRYSLCWWHLESTSGIAHELPIQIPFHRIREPNLPSQCRRSQRQCMSRRH